MSAVKSIVAQKGIQDKYLSHNPHHTQFKADYLRHSQFSKMLLKVEPDGYNYDTFQFGDIYTFEIEKNCDLLKSVLLEMTVQEHNNSDIVSQTMYTLIDYIELEISDKVIERLSGDWLYVYHLLDTSYSSKYTHADNTNSGDTLNEHTLYLEIPFWFSLTLENSLPVCALDNSPIRIRLKLRNRNTINAINNEIISKIQLINTVLDLTDEEKKIFKDTPLEYVITQVETIYPPILVKNQSMKKMIELPDTQFVSELLWVFRTLDNQSDNFFNFNRLDQTNYQEHTNRISLTMNGKKNLLPTSYYTKIQRMETYGINEEESGDSSVNSSISGNTIYCHSFGIENNVEPNGFLSFNKFNTLTLELDIVGDAYERQPILFLKNYNIMRFQNGYCELLF